jgi:cytochrome c biogenesis protein CcdA
MLTVFAALSLVTIALGPVPVAEGLIRMRQFVALTFLLGGLGVLFLQLRGGNPKIKIPLRQVLILSRDYAFGGVYALGIAGCGPIFATVGASAHLEGWPGIAQLGAYALGLLIITLALILLVASVSHLLRRFKREEELRYVRHLGALGLAVAGLLGYWA